MAKINRRIVSVHPAHHGLDRSPGKARRGRVALTHVLAIVSVAALSFATAGCKDRTGCGEQITKASSEVNAAIRDEDPAALRRVAGELTPVVAEAGFTNMRELPSTLESLAKTLESAKASGKPEDMSSFRAQGAGVDTSFDTINSWCE